MREGGGGVCEGGGECVRGGGECISGEGGVREGVFNIVVALHAVALHVGG